jgi:anaerobic selenocysteine-containing dehydrogenase
MKKEQETTAPKRRDFLKLAGLGSMTAVAGAAAASAPAEAKQQEPNPRGAGYRETTHVKQVYELARF